METDPHQSRITVLNKADAFSSASSCDISVTSSAETLLTSASFYQKNAESTPLCNI